MLKSLSMSAAAFLFAMVAACGDPNNCKEDETTCLCDAQTTECLWNCSGGNCTFTANDQAAAEFTCEGGGCTLNATIQSVSSFSCEGGGCIVHADEQAMVNLSCLGGGCTSTAADQASVNTADCTDCTCTPSDEAECDGEGVSYDE